MVKHVQQVEFSNLLVIHKENTKETNPKFFLLINESVERGRPGKAQQGAFKGRGMLTEGGTPRRTPSYQFKK